MIDAVTAALIGAGAAIMGGLLNGAYQHAREYWSRPILSVDYEGSNGNNPASEHKEGEKLVSEVYVRARVRNLGRQVVTGCRVFLVALHEVHHSGLTATSWYDSLPLPWAGWVDHQSRNIPKGPEFYVDVMRVSKSYSAWQFSAKTFASQSALRNYHGTYRFRLLATADNAEPAACEIDVTYDGDWHNLRAVQVRPHEKHAG
jgi:hypothetical protein